jgi:hypothetical protein
VPAGLRRRSALAEARRVKAAPAAAMRCFEAQVNGRGGGIRGEESIGELEEGVSPSVEALVERATENA